MSHRAALDDPGRCLVVEPIHVVYLAGAREVHAPDVTLDLDARIDPVDLIEQVGDAPLVTPDELHVGLSWQEQRHRWAGKIVLLRLERTMQFVAQRWPDRRQSFLFVLTEQDDAPHAAKDTAHFRPLLHRWAADRGVDFDTVTLQGPPNRLDVAARLLEDLDQYLRVAEEVVLFTSGGPAALQVVAHFASFQGVRHRDDLTVLQLEEVLEDGDQRPIDTRVRPVANFHHVIGRRTVDQQAIELIDQLDLPAAAQLVHASRQAGLIDDPSAATSQGLLRLLARELPPADAAERLAVAVDLAELEWSRPGGSRAQALWYALVTVVELLPAALPPPPGHPLPEIDDDTVRHFNKTVTDEAKRAGRASALAPGLTMAPAYLRKRALGLLLRGPTHLPLGERGRTLDLTALLGITCRDDDRPTALTWLALLVAVKPLRNEHAHDLVTIDRVTAETTIVELSKAFRHALGGFTPDLPPVRADADPYRDILQVLAQPPQPLKAAARRPNRRPAIDRIARGELPITYEQVAQLLTPPSASAERFAVLPNDASGPRAQVRELIGEYQRLAERRETGSLDLRIEVAAPASRFRDLCRSLVAELPATNRLVEIAGDLRRQLSPDHLSDEGQGIP